MESRNGCSICMRDLPSGLVEGEPCAGVFGDSGSRPLFQGGEEGFLREVFGEADVAGEAGDDAGGLDAPDGFDRAM